ncbi:hypothetical protein GBA52_009770 [Prunus armeniaca]|nr:hypothetical protein GBA52_009770 [Prunus armeniaca]
MVEEDKGILEGLAGLCSRLENIICQTLDKVSTILLCGVVISMPTRHTSVWRRRTISKLMIEKKVQWMDSRWSWASKGIPAVCIANDNRCINELKNRNANPPETRYIVGCLLDRCRSFRVSTEKKDRCRSSNYAGAAWPATAASPYVAAAAAPSVAAAAAAPSVAAALALSIIAVAAAAPAFTIAPAAVPAPRSPSSPGAAGAAWPALAATAAALFSLSLWALAIIQHEPAVTVKDKQFNVSTTSGLKAWLSLSTASGSREPAGAEITRVTEGAERMMKSLLPSSYLYL